MDPERLRQIETLLVDALDRDSAGRAAFLERACAGDSELRREVESLLAQQHGLSSFLELPAFAVPSSSPAPSAPLPASGDHNETLAAGDSGTQPATPAGQPEESIFGRAKRAVRGAMASVADHFGGAPGARTRDANQLAYYLQRAIRDRTQHPPPFSPTVADHGIARRYQRACALLSAPDRELIVSTIELGYSFEQTALATGRPSPSEARSATRQAFRRLVEQMGGRGSTSGSWLALEVAVLDGDDVDWERVRKRTAGSVALGFVADLEIIDRIARAGRAASGWTRDHGVGDSTIAPVLSACLAALAAVQVVAGVAGYAAGVASPGTVLPSPAIVTVLTFAAASGWLGIGGRFDTRARSLAVFYVLIAAAFAHQFLPGSEHSRLVASLRNLPPDAFLALFLWQFVGRFPRTVRYGLADRFCRLMERVAAVAGSVLFLVTALAPFGLDTPLRVLGRPNPGGFYWAVVLGLAAPAVPVSWMRARSSPHEERRRLALFTLGLAAGILPMLTVLLAEVASARVRQLMAGNRQIEAFALESLLLLVPGVTAYSVLVDRVFDVRVAVGAAVRQLFARATLAGISTLPFAALAVYAYRHRDLSLLELLSAGRGATVAALVSAGVFMWVARPYVLGFIGRRISPPVADIGRCLPQLASEARSAQSRMEFASLLEGRLSELLRAERVVLLARSPAGDSFSAVCGGMPDLPLGSALGALSASEARPLAVGPGETGSCFALLPTLERDWIEHTGVAALVPLVGLQNVCVGLVAAGRRRDQRPYSRQEMALLTGIAPAAALGLQLQSSREHDEVPPAAECGRCGVIGATIAEVCTCGSPRRMSALPAVVAGKYRVERRAGAGGMGVVYRGYDLALDRPVALKTLTRLSTGASRRLGREARVMASVVHPNLAMIYDLERWRDTPILVVEFLEGGTFSESLARGPQGPLETTRLGLVLASALQHLHERGILHRDVKPSNIAFSAGRTPKLLDFGLATLLAAEGRSHVPHADATAGTDMPEPRFTQSIDFGGRVIAGTPLYLSPEAARGGDPHPDFDLWALAMVLYEAIAGTHPFAAVTLLEVLSNVRAARVPDLRDYRPDCPERIACAFAVMLSGDRSQRPRTAAALNEILDRSTEG